jgi:hypothetical protein
VINKILIISLMVMVTLLQADYIVKYNMDGEIMEFMYKNSTTSKMLTNSEDGKVEIYHINKNSYIVSHTQEGVNIVDINAMKAEAKKMGFDSSMYADKQETPSYTIKKTGKKVKVAGINGEEWLVKGEVDGESYSTKVVLTNDKKVVKIMRAMFISLSDMSGGMLESNNLFEMKKGYVVIQADGMKLDSFKVKTLSTKVYELPKVTNTREAFNERNIKNTSPKTITKKRAIALDELACYDNLCCGEIQGESVVLKPSLYVNKGGSGTFLVDSATCKVNALGQRTESAILENNEGRIYLTLFLDDKNKGIVQKLIDGQSNYGASDSTLVSQASKDISGNKAMYIHSRNTNQERMDIYLANGATLCMARVYKDSWRRSFEGWSEKGWIFYKSLNNNIKNWNPSKSIPAKIKSNYKSQEVNVDTDAETETEVQEEDASATGVLGEDMDKAVNLLKSFF